jgi:hypothetical protein
VDSWKVMFLPNFGIFCFHRRTNDPWKLFLDSLLPLID